METVNKADPSDRISEQTRKNAAHAGLAQKM